MIRYTVVWEKDAQDQLAELWLVAPDRRAVTSAANAIERTLAEDAPEQGDEISEGLRAIVSSPLEILFVVREDDRIVEVVYVKRS